MSAAADFYSLAKWELPVSHATATAFRTELLVSPGLRQDRPWGADRAQPGAPNAWGVAAAERRH